MEKIYNLIKIKYKPNKDTFISFILWLAITGSMRIAFAFPVFKEISIFLFCAILSYFILGIFIPVRLIKRARELGIKRERWKISLIIGFIFSLFLAFFPMSKCIIPKYSQIIRLTILALSACLFEAIFFRGYLQIRLEEAFGVIPSIIIASICYALYHLSYPGWENLNDLSLLFWVGVLYSSLFLVTRNILILWPFSMPMGAMIDFFNHKLDISFFSSLGYLFILIIMVSYVFRLLKKEDT